MGGFLSRDVLSPPQAAVHHHPTLMLAGYGFVRHVQALTELAGALDAGNGEVTSVYGYQDTKCEGEVIQQCSVVWRDVPMV